MAGGQERTQSGSSGQRRRRRSSGQDRVPREERIQAVAEALKGHNLGIDEFLDAVADKAGDAATWFNEHVMGDGPYTEHAPQRARSNVQSNYPEHAQSGPLAGNEEAMGSQLRGRTQDGTERQQGSTTRTSDKDRRSTVLNEPTVTQEDWEQVPEGDGGRRSTTLTDTPNNGPFAQEGPTRAAEGGREGGTQSSSSLQDVELEELQSMRGRLNRSGLVMAQEEMDRANEILEKAGVSEQITLDMSNRKKKELIDRAYWEVRAARQRAARE